MKKKPNNLKQYLNKGISTPVGILIVLVVAVVASGVLIWQLYPITPSPSSSPTTLPTPSPSPSPLPFETTNWETYTNTEYGVEFRYPKEWGDITLEALPESEFLRKEFEAQRDAGVYAFLTEDEEVKKVWWHRASNNLAFVEKGQEFPTMAGEMWPQETLKIINPKGEIIPIYTVDERLVEFYFSPGSVNFSPDGEYVYFVVYGYEYSMPQIINIKSGKNIIEDYYIWLTREYIYKNVIWSPGNTTLAIKSETNYLLGAGIDGLFVSDYGDPEDLNQVFPFPCQQPSSFPNTSSEIYDFRFVSDDKISFSFNVSTRIRDCFVGDIIHYEYDVKTKELKCKTEIEG